MSSDPSRDVADDADDEPKAGAQNGQIEHAVERARGQFLTVLEREHQRQNGDRPDTEPCRPPEQGPSRQPSTSHRPSFSIAQLAGSAQAVVRAAVGLAALCFLVLAARAGADAPLILAFTPSKDPTALQEAADAFVAALAKLSGLPVRAQVASDYAGVVEAVRSRRVDFAFVHPVGYVLANREAGCQILVRDIWQGRVAYTARLYVRGNAGLSRLEDLRGKTIAFVDPASSSGYIYPMVLLMKRGLVRDRDPKTFFKEALFAGTHDAALQSLVHGRVDAAATFDKAPELYLRDKALIGQLTSVAETPEIPEAGICARPGLPAETLSRVKRALLAMKGPEHAAVLKGTYDIDGFVEASDRDYEPVRDAMKLM